MDCAGSFSERTGSVFFIKGRNETIHCSWDKGVGLAFEDIAPVLSRDRYGTTTKEQGNTITIVIDVFYHPLLINSSLYSLEYLVLDTPRITGMPASLNKRGQPWTE